MTKSACKIIFLLFTVSFYMSCDNYEFPETLYPRLETISVVHNSPTQITFKGTLSDIGEEAIVNHGFIWGLGAPLWIYSSNKVELGTASGRGAFDGEIITNSLTPGKTYYVRAF